MASKNSTYAEIGRRLREIPLEEHMSSYEWEELVYKLCDSADDELHNTGIRELGEMAMKQYMVSRKQ